MSRVPGLIVLSIFTAARCAFAVSSAESLTEPRRGAAAVNVGDRVLVAGGRTVDRPLDSVFGLSGKDAFRWKQFPPLLEARFDHAAAHLGSIAYVAGGRGNNGLLASVEKLSFNSSQWERVSPLSSGRADLVLFGIANRLYAVGGRGATGLLNDVEMYNPWLKRWQPRNRIPIPLCGAAGAVIGKEGWLIGGLIRRGGLEMVTDAVWIYDPATDFWRKGPSLPSPRSGAVAAVVAGRLIVVGGKDAHGQAIPESLYYNSISGKWDRLSSAPSSTELAGVDSGDHFMTIGGYHGDEHGSGDVSVMDYRGGTWMTPRSYDQPDKSASMFYELDAKATYLPAPNGVDTLPPEAVLSAPRWGAATVEFENDHYLIGGYGGGRFLNFVEVLDPAGYHWKPVPPLRRARAGHAVATDGKNIYVAGGFDQGGVMDSVEVFDAESRDWSALPALQTARSGLLLFMVKGTPCVLGGMGRDGPVNTIECLSAGKWSSLKYNENSMALPDPFYDATVSLSTFGNVTSISIYGGKNLAGGMLFATDASWGVNFPEMLSSRGYTLPTKRSGAALAALGGLNFIAGGVDQEGNPLNTLEIVENGARRPQIAAPMPTPRSQAAAFFREGRLYVVGGKGVGGKELDVVETYDPLHNRWAQAQTSFANLSEPPIDAAPPLATSRHPIRPHDYAIVVGIEGYKSLPPAAYGESDAREYKRQFEALGVPKENIVMLLGPRAGHLDIAKYVEEWLPERVASDSRVYLAFSGHGAPNPDDGNSFLVPWDGDPAFLKTTGYSLRSLYQKLDALPIKEAVVLLDACFSGAGGRSVIAKGIRPLVQVKLPSEHWRHLTVIAASKSEQIAGSLPDKKHGLFSYFVLEALGSGVGGSREHLSIQELYDYVRSNVVVGARNQGREQEPVLLTATPDSRVY